jgi:hypothetical protein
VRNQAWLALVTIAQDLLAWTASVCLDGALARAEPATLRYRLLHVGARLARRGAGTCACASTPPGPWREALDSAFSRLRAALC